MTDNINKNFINYITDDNDDRIKLSHIIDLYESSKIDNYIKNTNFLTRSQQELIFRNFPDKILSSFYLFGGLKNAERKVLLILPEYLTFEDIESDFDSYSPISYIRIHLPKFCNNKILSHRDYLGSLIGLNIKREMIGDINITENGADIIVISSISNFILDTLKKIGRVGVDLELLNSYKNLITPKNKSYEKEIVLTSLRIDNFISTAFNISRETSKNFIDSNLVSINGNIIGKYTKQVNIGDIITLRKKGRVKILSQSGITRKNNSIYKILIYK